MDSEQLRAFQQDGYVIVRQLFDPEEMRGLLAHAKGDRQLASESYVRKDGGRF